MVAAEVLTEGVLAEGAGVEVVVAGEGAGDGVRAGAGLGVRAATGVGVVAGARVAAGADAGVNDGLIPSAGIGGD